MSTDIRLDDDFLRLATPYRRELLAHCYRMLGSPHEAEDAVQETFLRAWRAYERFEGRSSLRTWLHRIATTTCLTALENRGRRPLPTGLDGTGSDPHGDLVRGDHITWLQPLPDSGGDEFADHSATDPAVVVTGRESVRLAFVAALQHLPPRQRAVLILRDVLKWKAGEVAEAVGRSTATVNSLLQRARARLDEVAPTADALTEPTEAGQRELLDRYVAAFERKDIPELVTLFTDDLVWEMPPYATWYRGPVDVATHLATRCPARPGGVLMVPTAANGQPAYAMYLRDDESGSFRAFCLQVLTLTGEGISHVVNFMDVEVFSLFDLPPAVPDGTARGAQALSSGMRDA